MAVEDDPAIADLLDMYLRREDHRVYLAADGERGLELIAAHRPDVVILDVGLPGIDGLEVCRRIRSSDAAVSVVFLTARDDEIDRVLGLEMGADDYVTKPFSPRELTARIKAVLRRSAAGTVSSGAGVTLRAGSLEVDPVAHEALRDGSPVHLTAKEFDLLVHLMRHPRRAFARRELLESVWGWTYGDTATVTVHVRRLRTKVEEDPSEPRHLVTVAGGYRFEP